MSTTIFASLKKSSSTSRMASPTSPGRSSWLEEFTSAAQLALSFTFTISVPTAPDFKSSPRLTTSTTRPPALTTSMSTSEEVTLSVFVVSPPAQTPRPSRAPVTFLANFPLLLSRLLCCRLACIRYDFVASAVVTLMKLLTRLRSPTTTMVSRTQKLVSASDTWIS